MNFNSDEPVFVVFGYPPAAGAHDALLPEGIRPPGVIPEMAADVPKSGGQGVIEFEPGNRDGRPRDSEWARSIRVREKSNRLRLKQRGRGEKR